ncbi:hypothetical protein [Herbidospora yilanensis]|uniref:hypothetical protein n=1 Tax=Herbidospora yilanensis TaxID=354426 RepID=UPI000A02BA46|nr:hypothetical protein [Herbidospora yilanensis]
MCVGHSLSIGAGPPGVSQGRLDRLPHPGVLALLTPRVTTNQPATTAISAAGGLGVAAVLNGLTGIVVRL